jgi:hypothetical protein
VSTVRFPKRRDDGSFAVIAEFTTSDTTIISLVNDFVKAWIRVNHSWIRIWRSDSIEEEYLDFYREFSSDPRVEVESEGAFCVVFEGRPSATRWKDFAVYMVKDISTVFPEVKFVKFAS